MSHLKILVCTLLVAVSVFSTASVNADHQYSGSQAASCARAGAYPSTSGAYGMGMSRQSYAPQLNYSSYPTQRSMGYDVPQRFSDDHTSMGYNRTSNFRDLHTRSRNTAGFDRADSGTAWGRESYGYRNMNSNRGSGTVYDSVHGDYHVVPNGGNTRQVVDPYRSGSHDSHNGRAVNLNFGW